MSKRTEQPAFLTNSMAPDLPPVVLNIPGRLQLCVDAGAADALSFFDELTSIGLHDHIAVSMHAFMRSLQEDMAAGSAPGLMTATVQDCTDAFAAGYLGRIQQELRFFKGEGRNGGNTCPTPHRQRCPH